MKLPRIWEKCDEMLDFVSLSAIGIVIFFWLSEKLGMPGATKVATACSIAATLIGVIKMALGFLQFLWRIPQMFRTTIPKNPDTPTTTQDGPKKKPTPNVMRRLWSLLLPEYCQERYLEPILEEMKEDRILAERDAVTAFQFRLIAVRFSLKTAGTFAAAIGCALWDLLAKLIPWLKKLFFGTGS
jgi:hypothetical protein